MTTFTGTVTWVEPHYGVGELPVDVTLSCSAQHAINSVRNMLAKRINAPMLTDEEALDHFIVVHWATWEADE